MIAGRYLGMQTDTFTIEPLDPSEVFHWRCHPSHRFENQFDAAIIGTTVNSDDRRVLVYSEEMLIGTAIDRLKDDADSDEEILWEDGAMWITDGLDEAIVQLGDDAPVIIPLPC